MPIADRSTAPAPRRHRLPSLSRGLCLAATLGATILGTQLAPATAEAGVPRVLRPGTRPLAFLFGLGPSWGVRDRYRGDFNGCGKGNPYCGNNGWYGGYGAFKVTQEFMGHFSGNASGAALGILMNQEFAGAYFGLNIAPKFTYDIQPKRDLGLYISPSFSLGYHLSRVNYGNFNNGYYYGGANYHAVNIQVGVAVKLMLDDRWLVWIQTPNFDFTVGPGNAYCPPGAIGCGAYFRARYDFLLGGGVTF